MNRLICILIAAGLAECAWADEFGDFRIPKHSVFRSVVDIYTWLERDKDERATQTSFSEYTAFQQRGSLFVQCGWLRETDLSLWNISANSRIAEDYLQSEMNHRPYYSDGNFSDGSSRRYTFSSYTSANTEFNWYPWSSLLGVSSEAHGTVYYDQRGDRGSLYQRYEIDGTDTESWDREEIESWGQQYEFSLTVGPSLGRVRNVTAVADALVMEQRLIEDGVVSGQLTQATKQKLADLLYRKTTYSLKYERWQKHFWKEVEEALQSDAAFSGELNAYETRRIEESYFGNMDRRRGFEVTPSIRYQHYDDIDHYWNHRFVTQIQDSVTTYEYDQYNSDRNASDSRWWGLSCSYFRPYGLRWQLGLDAYAMYNPNRFPGPDTRHEKQFDAGIHANLTWLIADRWYASSTADLAGRSEDEVGDHSQRRDHVYELLGFALGYQVQDNIEISLRFSEQYEWHRDRYQPYYGGYFAEERSTRSTNFMVGCSYSLAGPLRVPSYYPPYVVDTFSGQ